MAVAVAEAEPAEPPQAEADVLPAEALALAPEVPDAAEGSDGTQASTKEAQAFSAPLPVEPSAQEIPQEACAAVPSELTSEPASDAAPATEPPAASEAASAPAEAPPQPESDGQDVGGELPPEPGFVRAARRRAFWHSTGVRLFLLLLGLVAVAGMALQMAVHQRNALAAAQPQLRPWLEQACAWLG
ncbi:MAG: DUF3426 domain-containing protein, partial [Paenacidovorax caeni]